MRLNRLRHLKVTLWALASLGLAACGEDNAPTPTPGEGEPPGPSSGGGGDINPPITGNGNDDNRPSAFPNTPGGFEVPTELPLPANFRPGEQPPIGATDFVSADGSQGQEGSNDRSANSAPESGDAAEDSDGGSEATVEEGDIYRVFGESLILNLNNYRGLQVISFADPSNPTIVGRLQVSGGPVEMYTVGDRAIVLLNNWTGYYGGREDVHVETRQGGLVLSVDLSDPTAPRELARAYVPGWIMKSRLTRDGDYAALFVAASGYQELTDDAGNVTWQNMATLKSFDVSDGRLTARSELNLGGYVSDIQATPEVLMVASNDWRFGEPDTEITLVDISDARGRMEVGDTVQVSGYVRSQFNMDFYNDVLRVVSDGAWGLGRTNYLQTFDASDLSDLTRIDSDTFGDGQQLFATLFLGNKAFFVTYLRMDPFHAFEIDDNGQATERSEFIVSGWNDFFRDVSDETRLIGIGVNDTDGRKVAVSLYDIRDLDNADPLIARAEIDMEWGWSEASWDHQAFSVLEDAVDVMGKGNTRETGLVLLPYSGWDNETSTSHAGVQIFTFSDTTLTLRGSMNHGSYVRRSFQPERDLTTNISETEMSFFDTANPDEPSEEGRVELAPNYTDILVFGDYGARVKDASYYYSWYWGGRGEAPATQVQIIGLEGDPDLAESVATFEVPSGASLHQVGDLLVSASLAIQDSSTWPYSYTATLDVWDLTDPTHPEKAGTLVTDEISPFYGYYWGGPYRGEMDCFDCGWGWSSGQLSNVFATSDALTFLEGVQQQELQGIQHVRNIYANESVPCNRDDGWCPYYSGGIYCTSLNDGPETCTGEISYCDYDDDASWSCTPVDTGSVTTSEYTYEYELYRYWNEYSLEVLNLSDPTHPALGDTIALADEGLSGLVSGDSVYITTQDPISVENDSRAHVRYFFTQVDLSDPASPEVHDRVNIPGTLLGVEGNVIYTRDLIWGETRVQTTLDRLVVHDGLAYLQAVKAYENRYVQATLLDGAGHLLVTHQQAWYDSGDAYDSNTYLSVLDTEDLDERSNVAIDYWATLNGAEAGRALFQVSGGLLVISLEDPSQPAAQAYFPTMGWPHHLRLLGEDIYFAGGLYGLYRFNLDETNLLSDEVL